MTTAAFFDLDHTLLDGDSDSSFLDYLVEIGELSPGIIEAKEPIGRAYMAGEPWQDAYRQLIRRIYRGRAVARMEGHAKTHARERAAAMVFAGAQDLLETSRQRYGSMMLLTTTNQVVAEPIASLLGLDGVLSTRLVHSGGVFTGAIEGDRFCTGPGKAEALLRHCDDRGLDPGNCAMFGDGRSDMEALAAVGTPYAVHPNDALKDASERSSWPVLDLSASRVSAIRGDW